MRRRRVRQLTGNYLQHHANVQVRFQEVDALRIVWHGHYLSYFEIARVEFGKKYGLNYTDFVDAQLLVPVVHASCDYIQSASFQDELDVTARLYKQVSAKLHYVFEIRRAGQDAILAKGETVHVFTDMNSALCLTMPQFMIDWYARWDSEMLADG